MYVCKHPSHRAALCTEELSTAKLLSQYGAQQLNQPHRLDLVNIHQMARPAHIR